jgi:hypothetical protein
MDTGDGVNSAKVTAKYEGFFPSLASQWLNAIPVNPEEAREKAEN